MVMAWEKESTDINASSPYHHQEGAMELFGEASTDPALGAGGANKDFVRKFNKEYSLAITEVQAKQIWNKWNEGSAAKKAYRDLKMGTAKDIYDNLFSVQAEQKSPDPVQPIQEELDPYGQRLLQHVGTYFIYAQHHPHRFDADVGRYFELVHTGNGYFNMEGDLDLTVSSTSSISWPNVDSYRTQLPAKESTPQRIIGTSSLLNSDFQHTKFCAVRDDQRLVKLFEHCSLIRRNAVFEIEVLQKEPMYRRLRTKRDVAMTLRVDDGMWTEVSINQIMNVYRQ